MGISSTLLSTEHYSCCSHKVFRAIQSSHTKRSRKARSHLLDHKKGDLAQMSQMEKTSTETANCLHQHMVLLRLIWLDHTRRTNTVQQEIFAPQEIFAIFSVTIDRCRTKGLSHKTTKFTVRGNFLFYNDVTTRARCGKYFT